ncbi:MAG: BA14K family protein, partial [Pseudaminobacter sp.]|nr:BA14K family protein [Pseudaminobacter sp.]
MPLRSDAVKVDTALQDFERIERRPAAKPLMQENAPEPEVGIDNTTTASVNDPRISEPASQSADHVNWCTDRYRSYRPENNTYTSYSGDMRECISPFLTKSSPRPPP